MNFARRLRNIQPSVTLAITGKAKKMIAEGINVVSLSAGEPDFNVPDVASDAAIRAIREKKNRYTPVPGIPELRAEIASKLERENGLSYAPEQVTVCAGAKIAIAFAVLALLEEGDEALIPSPYWVSYPPQVELARGKPVFVPCRAENGYLLDPADVEAACTGRTRLLILNSPNNPTGAVLPEETLARLASLAEKKDLLVISDEIYEKLVYGSVRHVSIASLSPGAKERTLVVNGFSKAWAMPGWRLGYCAGPKAWIDAIGKILGHTASNAPSIVQYAGLAALQADDAPVQAMREEFERRRDFVCRRVAGIDGISAPVPDGAFYLFIDCTHVLPSRVGSAKLETCADLALALLENAHVASVPGGAFGAPGFLRISYASSMEDLEKGLDRIEAFLGKLERE